MTTEYQAIFIDESGIGSLSKSKTNNWVTVGIQSDLQKHYRITKELKEFKTRSLRLYNKELKGTNISRNHLNPNISKEDVAKDIANIVKNNDISVIITSCNMSPKINYQTKFKPSNEKRGLQAKDIARELLLERFSMKNNTSLSGNNKTNLLIWDLSDTNELSDFSSIVDNYTNPHNSKKTNNAMITHILGGLSHEWAELQIADFISNYAPNYISDGRYYDSDREKSSAFKKYLYPILYSHNGKIDGFGLKTIHID